MGETESHDIAGALAGTPGALVPAAIDQLVEGKPLTVVMLLKYSANNRYLPTIGILSAGGGEDKGMPFFCVKISLRRAYAAVACASLTVMP